MKGIKWINLESDFGKIEKGKASPTYGTIEVRITKKWTTSAAPGTTDSKKKTEPKTKGPQCQSLTIQLEIEQHDNTQQ